jgi:DNA modification methylase
MYDTVITYLSIKNLKSNEKNPRKINPEQFQKLCQNIQNDPEFFAMRPCLVNETEKGLIVYAGNQRLKAAKKIGMKEIPCVVTKDTPEDLIKKRIILDNIHHGEHDLDMLADLYDNEELLELGMSLEDLELDKEIEEIASDEDDDGTLSPGEDKDAVTQLGDVYELNGHRLVCGDSTMPEVVEKVLSGAVPILMVTDPPYGVEYDPAWRIELNGKKTKNAVGKVQNDDKVNWALAWSIFPGAIAYIWHAGKFCSEVEKSLTDSEYEIISQIIWAKQHFALSRGDYHWHHEPCWYAVKKGCDHNWQGARDQSTLWEIANLNCFGKSKEDGEERTAHSTQKPIECMARPIRNNTAKGEGVYDPFLGSGTTLIAAEQLGRICYGIELSPAYCDIIVNRWANYMKKNNRPFEIKRDGEPFTQK